MSPAPTTATISASSSTSARAEHFCKGAVPGEFLGIPGHGREIGFRLLHIWEFRDGLMSRENVWLDGGTVIAQLAA